jgi:hypothetical protein
MVVKKNQKKEAWKMGSWGVVFRGGSDFFYERWEKNGK